MYYTPNSVTNIQKINIVRHLQGCEAIGIFTCAFVRKLEEFTKSERIHNPDSSVCIPSNITNRNAHTYSLKVLHIFI